MLVPALDDPAPTETALELDCNDPKSNGGIARDCPVGALPVIVLVVALDDAALL